MKLGEHRLGTLQAARAAAAFGVVGYHIAPTADEGWQSLYQLLFSRGHIGVDLFFVLSGFLMAKHVLSPTGGVAKTKAFFIRRFFRVWPLYALLTTLYYFTFAHSSFEQYLRSLFFLPVSSDPPLVLGFPTLFVGWTLNYEFYFYMVCAIFLLVTPLFVRIGSMVLWFLATLVVLPLLFGHPLWVSPLQTQPEHYPILYMALVSNPIILEFLLGMAVFVILSRIGNQLRKEVVLFLSIAGVAQFIVLYFVIQAKMEVLACGFSAAGLVAALVLGETKLAWQVPTSWVVLGNASYGIYLIHPFWLNIAQPLREHWPQWPWLWFGFIFAATALSALLLYYVFERPINKWAHQLAGQLEKRQG